MPTDTTLTIRINTPAPGNVGESVTVTGGGALIVGDGVHLDTRYPSKLTSLSVQFGAGTPRVPATVTGTGMGFTCTSNVPTVIQGGSQFAIDVQASCSYRTVDGGGDGGTTDPAHDSVVVTLLSPPTLLIDKPPVDVTPAFPYVLTLTGTATAALGMASVTYSLESGPLTRAVNTSGDWGHWSAAIPLLAGEHTLTIQATDTHNTVASQSFTFAVLATFKGVAEQVFAPTTYLSELLNFAERWIGIGTAKVTRAQLADQFSQPFVQLILPECYTQATTPIHQSRIAIEVLRKQPKPTVPADTEQRFLSLAYQALLRELGTSSEDLRLGRTANAAARTALAARIGIEIGATRPDALDRITLLPANTTDDALEQIFGYRSTNPADPLAMSPTTQSALVPTWMQSALRGNWRRQDVATRDSAKGFVPIVDPDLLTGGNFVAPLAGNPAYALWSSRRGVMTAKLAEISQYGAAETNPATRFDALMQNYLPKIDLDGLAVNDANGADIAAQLAAFNLSLDGFRFLALCRQLLASSVLLDSEWDDIHAIVLQSQKQGFFSQWRAEEKQAVPVMVLGPDQFLPNLEAAAEIPRWRGTSGTLSQWQRTLIGRIAQSNSVASSYEQAVDSAEAQTLPGLRDALLQWTGANLAPPLAPDLAAENLSRTLLIDLLSNSNPETTRVDQAIETLQGVLLSVRSGSLTAAGDMAWKLVPITPTATNPDPPTFDKEWIWMGTYRTWLAAIKVFAYPENQLAPNLYVADALFLTTTKAFSNDDTGLLRALRKAPRMTPQLARTTANYYFTTLSNEITPSLSSQDANLLAACFLTDQRSDADLRTLKETVQSLFDGVTNPSTAPQYARELFWLAPMAIALRLQEDREYVAALDWFRTVYAYNVPPGFRKIYYGLTLEEPITTAYNRAPEWLSIGLNPHIIARTSSSSSGMLGRKDAYTAFTVMSIVKCFLAYADLQFSKNLAESTAEARTLYDTAVDLLGLIVPPDPKSGSASTSPFPPNPLPQSLLLQAQNSLAKIHNGMNIAGVRIDGSLNDGAATIFLPSQYRYAFLIDRAKNLVGICQQVEAAFLAALEKRDAETYSVLQANNDIRVAASSITLANLKVADAEIGLTEAQLQKQRAIEQYDHYDTLIKQGLNFYEEAQLASLAVEAIAKTASDYFSLGGLTKGFGSAAIADDSAIAAQAAGLQASYERREGDWQLAKSLANIDCQSGNQQILHAQNQQLVAQQDQQLAGLQLDHATAVLDFLANKFTNVELFEWMSGVLGGVYGYFLQQATSIARLAEAQLAFERQAPAPGFIQSDYWQDASDSANAGSAASPDRQGMTGSARLLQDMYELDEYAVETDSRKLHITQTVIASQVAALELQQFRDTGVLLLPTPMSLFDMDFPGHYLRLIKSVAVSVIALVPPVRGVRATLSASGLSRVIVPGDGFTTVTLSRSPEAISFTSPVNAMGLFDTEMLLPFEGMGVDTIWQLELPKAANPFDYRTIADVQLTIRYTALNSYDYRQQVVRSLAGNFSGDRSFSIRDEFPDAWYELNNPETVADATSRMKASLSTQSGDFPPHLEDVAVQQVTLFCLCGDGVAQEVNILSLGLSIDGQPPITAAEVHTTRSVVGTRRPGGAPWQSFVGQSPAGVWSIQFEDTDATRALFKNGVVLDVVLVLTVTGTPPSWIS